jgi:hypothetical protein
MILMMLQAWTGGYFQNRSLRDLKMVFNLGHNGSACPLSFAAQNNFTVFDMNGIHVVDIRFCKCLSENRIIPNRVQLLRIGWFPASITSPHSAVTFDTLRTFHLLTLQSKISAYDFCRALQYKTDNTAISVVKVLYLFFSLLPNQTDMFPGPLQAIFHYCSFVAIFENA